MPADPFAAFEAALPIIIAESPSDVLRYRSYAADTFRDPTDNYVAGPYSVRIEPYKAATSQDVWDEKGSVARLLFQMVCYNLPDKIEHEGVLQPLFQLDDRVEDQHGNAYRVVAPQYVRGKLTQVTLELRG